MFQVYLRFFDVKARIRSDSAEIIDLFTQMYGRFRVDGSLGSRPVREFLVLTEAGNEWGQPVLVLDGEVRPLRDPGLLAGFVYESILNSIVAGVRSHFLIHAGVVAHQGQGLILAADSTHGKTTLVLELVRRGFLFLSDEMAALGRADRQVYPFPRSLRLRPGTLELAGFPQAAHGAPRWLDKLLLDIDAICPGSLGGPAAIRHIVILHDPAEADQSAPPELGLIVDRLEPALLEGLRQVQGVLDVRPESGLAYPALKLRGSSTGALLAQLSVIETLCRQHQVLLLDLVKRAESHPSFDRPARLEVIPPSQAALQLLRRFLGGHKSALLQADFGGSSTQLFMELMNVIGQANCYQLSVGPLHQAADLVSGLVEPT